MGEITGKAGSRSLRKSLIFYITAFAFAAILLSGMTTDLCGRAEQKIKDSYPAAGRRYYLTDEDGNRLGDGAYIGTVTEPFSKRDEQILSALRVLSAVAAPVWSALCILAAALLFYHNRLERPLKELKAASEKISENDLDFRVEYQASDELGQLCRLFETMRSALAANFSEMWRQIEDRRQLNAAFSHELRTPLTVLKGYDELLCDSPDDGTRKIAATMEKHIARMEHYVESMGSLRRLEDLAPKWERVSVKELTAALYEGAAMECRAHGKTLVFRNRTHGQELVADRSGIVQVCGNLTANAVRYAVSEIRLCVEEREGGLLLSVSDDGAGFSEDALQKAANPYFTEEKESGEHFGIGLYLCRLLCEHNGGRLVMENGSPGARVTAYFRCR